MPHRQRKLIPVNLLHFPLKNIPHAEAIRNYLGIRHTEMVSNAFNKGPGKFIPEKVRAKFGSNVVVKLPRHLVYYE